jgi:hypothetical protein
VGVAEGRHDGRDVRCASKREAAGRRKTGRLSLVSGSAGKGEAFGGRLRGSEERRRRAAKRKGETVESGRRVVLDGARGVVQGRRVAADDALILLLGCSNCERAAPSISTRLAAVDWPVNLRHARGWCPPLGQLTPRVWREYHPMPSATNLRPDRDAVQNGRDVIVICLVHGYRKEGNPSLVDEARMPSSTIDSPALGWVGLQGPSMVGT